MRKYKAIIYEQVPDGNGGIHLRPVTSAQYLTVPTIAASLGISVQSVYAAFQAGKLAGLRFGATIRVPIEEYVKWLAECRHAEYERPMRREDLEG